ncbi:MAG TPA: alkaline phosphatase PhoX, partial [Methylocella sp.]|nr:alkaline phosphatase PhoX [Methylocella sp.]
MTHDASFSGATEPMEPEDTGSNPTANPTIGEIIAERMSRRDFANGMLAASAIAAAPSRAFAGVEAKAPAANTTPSFLFTELQAGFDETHHVAKGYYADVLIRWGDKVLFDAPRFDPYRQSASAQAKQFGYNNDYIGYIPLNPYG